LVGHRVEVWRKVGASWGDYFLNVFSIQGGSAAGDQQNDVE
jgi:hypothetical protein